MRITSLDNLIHGNIYKILLIDAKDYFYPNAAIFVNKLMRYDANRFCFYFLNLTDELVAERCNYSNSIGYAFLIGTNYLFKAQQHV
jgi:hypothetical protein